MKPTVYVENDGQTYQAYIIIGKAPTTTVRALHC